ncbi:FKBP-type peptidyl-prolyl cis-trans isomerase [Bacteroidota bacterium]
MKYISYFALLLLSLALFSCASSDTSKDKDKQLETITTPSGLKFIDLVGGTGAQPLSGQIVVVHYTGTLDDGTVFESSVEKNQPIEFRLGAGNVIKGWDEGILGMKIGGKRKLIIPPELGYGARSAGPIPSNSTLTFEVELLEIK